MGRRVSDSRIFKRSRAFAYLEEADRYLARPPEPEFSYGFIGCGMMGIEHMRNARLVGRATIGGLYDPQNRSIEHAREALGEDVAHARIYDSLEDACADPSTDALIIATPNHTHLDVMRTVAGCDKALFLEKPIAISVPDALEVCRLADGHPRPVRIGLQYRYKAIYTEAIREVLELQHVGRVHSVSLLEHRFPFLDKVGQWNKFNDQSGGSLVEKCCHYFDLMNLFAGARPRRVFAMGNQAVNFRDFEYGNRRADGLDQAQVTVGYENDVIGAFSLAMFVPGAREELVVCGEEGRLQAAEQALLGEPVENRLEIWRGENGPSRSCQPTYPAYIERAGHHGSTFFEHVGFAEDLERGVSSGPTLEEGFWSVVVAAAAQQSIERGEAVDVAELLPERFEATFSGTSKGGPES